MFIENNGKAGQTDFLHAPDGRVRGESVASPLTPYYIDRIRKRRLYSLQDIKQVIPN